MEMSAVLNLKFDSPLIAGLFIRPDGGAGVVYRYTFRKDVQEWCDEVGIGVVRIRQSEDCQHFVLTFVNEVDAVAFRMRF